MIFPWITLNGLSGKGQPAGSDCFVPIAIGTALQIIWFSLFTNIASLTGLGYRGCLKSYSLKEQTKLSLALRITLRLSAFAVKNFHRKGAKVRKESKEYLANFFESVLIGQPGMLLAMTNFAIQVP